MVCFKRSHTSKMYTEVYFQVKNGTSETNWQNVDNLLTNTLWVLTVFSPYFYA